MCKGILILLMIIFATNISFAQKKNSLTYQNGIINHFYDERPIILNTIYIPYIKRIRDIPNNLLIKSRGLNYSRILNDKVELTLIGAFFRTEYPRKNLYPSDERSEVIFRKWFLLSIEYNRKIIDKPKLDVFYGGGIIYRRGYEIYRLFKIPLGPQAYESVNKAVGKEDLGVTLNFNLKYYFKKRFYFYSKIDLQYYFYESKRVRNEFTALKEHFPYLNFEKTNNINHTLTIGIGVDF